MVSRNLKDDEKAQLKYTTVGIDALAVWYEKLADLYTGR
jgi:ABC-type phosphate transport system substrate-binding protein